MLRIVLGLITGSLLVFTIGCAKAEDTGASGGTEPAAAPAPAPAPAPAAEAAPAPTPAAAANPAEEAKALFTARCTICHGESGKGDGATAASLNPKPRDYTNAEWQKSVTDDDLKKVIVEGGPAAGKSPLMPANPDLGSKPEVVNELVKLIRSFAPQG